MTGAPFCWHELLTTDVEAAQRFYGEVLGWEAVDGSGYSVWHRNGEPVAGLRRLPERARQAGAPPNWLGHVGVSDLTASIERARNLGAQPLGPIQAVSEVGRFAQLRDPQGAVFSACVAEPTRPPSGAIAWRELHTTDAAAAGTFYSELFGWSIGEFTELDLPVTIGGEKARLTNHARSPQISTHWLYYLATDHLDRALAAVRSRGGRVLKGPTEVAAGESLAQCEDSQGAAFALRQAGPREGGNPG